LEKMGKRNSGLAAAVGKPSMRWGGDPGAVPANPRNIPLTHFLSPQRKKNPQGTKGNREVEYRGQFHPIRPDTGYHGRDFSSHCGSI